jgi:hypothetical protein
VLLHDIWQEFNRRLSHLGTVVIAGGAVRDHHLNRLPKDVDVFILGARSSDRNTIRQNALAGLEVVPPTAMSDYQLGPVATVTYRGLDVQVMVTPHTTIASLLTSFDWNVCKFAYGEYGFTNGEVVDNLLPGNRLVLGTIGRPTTNLRRGFNFATRYNLRLDTSDLVTLCTRIVEEQGYRVANPYAVYDQVSYATGTVAADTTWITPYIHRG